MKKFVCFLLSLLLICSLVSCGGSQEAVAISYEEVSPRLVCVYKDSSQGPSIRIYKDIKTNVAYLFMKSGYGGGLTIMEDADGNPLLWED